MTADTNNMELPQTTYTAMLPRPSKQEQSLYASTQQQQHIYESTLDLNEKPAVSSSSLIPALESKEVVGPSSNIQHVTNGVGNYSIQKERVKWSILILILLIASALLNVVTLIASFTTRSCSCNTSSSYDNTTDEKLLDQQVINMSNDNTRPLL